MRDHLGQEQEHEHLEHERLGRRDEQLEQERDRLGVERE
jgi:hypothetical protein